MTRSPRTCLVVAILGVLIVFYAGTRVADEPFFGISMLLTGAVTIMNAHRMNEEIKR